MVVLDPRQDKPVHGLDRREAKIAIPRPHPAEYHGRKMASISESEDSYIMFVEPYRGGDYQCERGTTGKKEDTVLIYTSK